MKKNTGNRFISWKYWHSPYLHAMPMYNECCDGYLDPSWKVELKDHMSYAEFLMTLSEEILTYDPRNNVHASAGGNSTTKEGATE